MGIKLILNTPAMSIEGHSPKKSIDLKSKDFEDKTIKEVVSKYVFQDILQGQEEEVAQQAIQLMFNFIQPVAIENVESWWEKPFSSLIIKGSKEIVLDLEFSPEGKAFIEQMM